MLVDSNKLGTVPTLNFLRLSQNILLHFTTEQFLNGLSLIRHEVILTSAERILTTFYFLIPTDCFMPNPLIRQSSETFI